MYAGTIDILLIVLNKLVLKKDTILPPPLPRYLLYHMETTPYAKVQLSPLPTPPHKSKCPSMLISTYEKHLNEKAPTLISPLPPSLASLHVSFLGLHSPLLPLHVSLRVGVVGAGRASSNQKRQ